MNTNSRWNANYTLFGRPSIVSTVLNFGGTYTHTHTHTRPHTRTHTHTTRTLLRTMLFIYFSLTFFLFLSQIQTYGVGIGIAVDMFGRTIVDRLPGWLTKPYAPNNVKQDRIILFLFIKHNSVESTR